MEELQLFENSQFGRIRVIEVNSQPYFVGLDVANALGYVKPRNAISQHVDNEDALKQGVPDNQGLIQETTLINESGVYALVFGSKLPTAKAFKRWVTSEILPSIRKTGSYSIQHQIPQSFSEALMLAAKQAKQIEEQQRQIDHKNGEISTLRSENAELQVQSEYARVILQNKSTALVTQIAQDYGMSAVKFNAMLRDMGIQRKVRSQWILTAPYIGKGYVQSSSFGFNHSDGTPDVSMTTEWTQRGRLFLYTELKRHGVLPLIESQAIIKFKN